MLVIKNVSFYYNSEITIKKCNFSIDNGKILAVIGESGCGKSTLLKLIYGLYDLNEGQIVWNDIEVLGPKHHLIPGMDFMKYLSQDFDLMPFISVAENVGKYLSNVNLEEKKNRISELLEIVEMTEFSNVKAKCLSGGQMQRVAIARVLALEPEVLLLDEPFSHIDNFRKNSLRRKLFAYLKEKEITTLVATHDCTDVLSFSDEVLIMKKGEIIEKGTPKFIYQNPSNFYTASLFGDVNELIIDGNSKLVYPNQLIITEKSDIKVTVVNSYFRGSHYLIEGKYNTITVYFENDIAIPKKTTAYLKIR